MFPAAAAMLGFVAAFAAWRLLLGNSNWLEGGLFALVVGVLAGLLTHATLRIPTVRSPSSTSLTAPSTASRSSFDTFTPALI